MRRALLFCAMLCLASPATAEIYRYLDENGNPVFTNQPPDGVAVKPVEIDPANTIDIPEPEVLLDNQPEASAVDARPYRVLELTGVPDDEAALRANGGRFTVGVRLEPALMPSHRLRFLFDGTPVRTGTATSIQMSGVARGEHTLQVVVLSGSQIVQRSEPRTFTVQRVHTSSPAFKRPPAPPAGGAKP